MTDHNQGKETVDFQDCLAFVLAGTKFSVTENGPRDHTVIHHTSNGVVLISNDSGQELTMSDLVLVWTT